MMLDAAVLTLSLVCPQEYGSGLNKAKEDLYNERFAAADVHVLEARTHCPSDPESYELRTSLIILWLRQTVRNSGDKMDRCADCRQLLAEFDSEHETGRKLVESALREEPESERLLFLSSRLHLNRVWLNLDLLGKERESNGPYRKAKKELDAVLAKNPRHVRALVASGWINYVIASRGRVIRLLLRTIGIAGSKSTAFENIALAVSIEGEEYAYWEAKFTLKDLLWREKRFSEAEVLGEELRARFPRNGTLNGKHK